LERRCFIIVSGRKVGEVVEVRIRIDVPDEVAKMIEDLCFRNVGGMKVSVRSQASVIREALYRGLRSMLEERLREMKKSE